MCNHVTVTRRVDYSALRSPVTKHDVDAYRRESRAAGFPWATTFTPKFVLFGVCLIAFAVAVSIAVVNFFSAVFASADGAGPGTVTFIVLLSAVLAGALVQLARVLLSARFWESWLRLTRFAQDNTFEFSPESPSPAYPGSIFFLPASSTLVDHVRSRTGPFFEVGTYRSADASGDQRVTNRGFIAARIEQPIPPLTLHSAGARSILGLAALRHRSPHPDRLPIAAGLGDHFTLYGTAGHENDARALFTPGLVALLVNSPVPVELEVVDDWVFVYSTKPFGIRDSAVMEWALGIVNAVQFPTPTTEAGYSLPAPPRSRRLLHGAILAGGAVVVVGIAVTLIVTFLVPALAGETITVRIG